MLTGRATELQDTFRDGLLAGEVSLDTMWGQPCRSYNLYLDIAAASGELSAVQDRVLAAEPSLLRVPRAALHSNATWLVPVYLDLPVADKDRLWQRHGPGWLSVLSEEIPALGPGLRLRFRDVVASDSAIIALAWPTEPVNELRDRLAGRLRLGRAIGAGPMVHTTLFRYRDRPRDPGALLDTLARLDVDIPVEITHVHVAKEEIFPNLAFEVIWRAEIRANTGVTPG